MVSRFAKGRNPRLFPEWEVCAIICQPSVVQAASTATGCSTILPGGRVQTMSRTTGAPDNELGFRARMIYWLTKRRRGRIHLATRVRAYDPKLLELAFRMDLHTAAQRTVPAILKQLAQIKVAVMVGCPL